MTAVSAGDRLPPYERTFGPVDLMAYGAATWDWHRLHYDQEYVRTRKLPKVIIDGQMYGALFAKQAMDWAGPRAFITRMSVKMRSMGFVGDTLKGEGEVTEVRPGDNHDVVVLAQRLLNGDRLTAESVTELRLRS